MLAVKPSGSENGIILMLNLSSLSDNLSSVIGIGLTGTAQISPAGNTYSYFVVVE